jgi:3-oxoacyl-[acyl-carrier-protein] synthase II
VFHTLFATSTKNDAPASTPRPFDKKRDGLVVGEGAATLVLEDLEHAKARGATPLIEIVGFATNSDGMHVTQPDDKQQARAMNMALADAGVSASAIGYVSAHGTATDRGDVAEARATANVLGNSVPVSSMKSYVGHTLGACGAIEAAVSLCMLQGGWVAATRNLDEVDERCAPLDYVMGAPRQMRLGRIMSNKFAFGGINTSLIFAAS